jgi:hypothetical protein
MDLQLYIKDQGEFFLVGVVPGKEIYFLGHSSQWKCILDKVFQYAKDLSVPDDRIFYRGKTLRTYLSQGMGNGNSHPSIDRNSV